MSMRDHLAGKKSGGGTAPSPSIFKIVIISAILIVLTGTLFTFYLIGKRYTVVADPNSLCPTDRPPSEIIVVLLDLSDIFSDPQRIKLLSEIQRLQATISQYGLIEVYVINQLDQRVVQPMIHLCNPGNGVTMNPIYQNPALAQKRWDNFITQFGVELSKLMSLPESQTSPIFEVIQASALRTFNRPEYDGIPKRLVIVSDLIQNMPRKLSQLHEITPFEEFQIAPYFTEVRCDLTDVHVTILYLVRTSGAQRWPEHKEFWEAYFMKQGAFVDRLEPIFGPQ